MINKSSKALISLLILLTCQAAWGEGKNVAGYVSGIRGKAYISYNNGEMRPLITGDPVYTGGHIRTEKGSRIKISFQDRTIVTLGELASVKLLDYLWSDTEEKGRFRLKISDGFFRIIGGKITKSSPKFFVSETPVASIGIRGSSYAGRVSNAGLLVFLESGKGIEVYSKRGSVALLSPGMGTTVSYSSLMPAKPRIFNSMERRRIIRGSAVGQDSQTGGSKIDSRATIQNQAVIKNSKNLAVGENNKANMGSIQIQSSDVSGTIINKTNISGSSNISQGQNNNANTGAVIIK